MVVMVAQIKVLNFLIKSEGNVFLLTENNFYNCIIKKQFKYLAVKHETYQSNDHFSQLYFDKLKTSQKPISIILESENLLFLTLNNKYKRREFFFLWVLAS